MIKMIAFVIAGLCFVRCNGNKTSSEWKEGIDSLEIKLWGECETLKLKMTESGTHIFIRNEEVRTDSTINEIATIIDGLFITGCVPVYTLKKPIDDIGQFTDGCILTILKYHGKDLVFSDIDLYNVYTNKPQTTDDNYEIIYSRQFKYLMQYLYFITDQYVGDDGFNNQLEYMRRMMCSPEYEVLYPPVEELYNR